MAIPWNYDAPVIVAKLDYETLRSSRIAAFLLAWQDFRIQKPALPEYNVENLETDPAVISLEAAATGDLNLRAQLNDTARASMIRAE